MAKVQVARLRALGCDTAAKIDAPRAAALRASGLDFILRYLSLDSIPPSTDLDALELRVILAAGLSLMAVQHCRKAGALIPTRSLGFQDGGRAVRHAMQCGISSGVTLWCDLEGVASGVSSQDVVDYANAWWSVVRSGGYEPGVYVGAGVPLTKHQWYSDLNFTRYWKSLSDVETPSPRGFCMVQLYPTASAGGVPVDFDVIQSDFEGGFPHWLAPD